jgi:hypothetical protein
MAEPTFKLQGAKEIADMFGALPKQINQYNVWKALWRKIGKPALNDAKSKVPKKTGQLKNSLGFFTTRKTKKFMGLYLGPRTKRTFKDKKKSGYYGSWIEYGDEVMFWGKGVGKAQKYMKPAWNTNKMPMTQKALKEATEIAAKAIKRHEKRLKKYGRAGY